MSALLLGSNEIVLLGSAEGTERIFDQHTCDGLSRIEILGEKARGTRLRGGCNDEGIPKSNLGRILDLKSRRDIRRSDVDAPNRVGANHQTRRVLCQRHGDSARNGEVEFLQYLWAQKACSVVPQFTQGVSCDFVF